MVSTFYASLFFRLLLRKSLKFGENLLKFAYEITLLLLKNFVLGGYLNGELLELLIEVSIRDLFFEVSYPEILLE